MREACWSPGSAALRAPLTFKRADEAGLTGHPVLGGLKWASRPFVLYPACLFGAAKGTNRPPAHRLPSRLKYYRAKKSENLNGMQWTG